MPIARRRASLFTFLWFAREGDSFTVPSAGTVSQTSKPGADDTSFFDLGVSEEFKLAPEGSSEVIMSGAPGGLVAIDEIPLDKMWKASWTAVDLTHVAVQLLMGHTALTAASNSGNILQGDLIVKGYLKFQAYDGGHNLRISGEKWGSLKVTDVQPWSGKNPFKAKFEFNGLRSAFDVVSYT